jgi:hypothetical protein
MLLTIKNHRKDRIDGNSNEDPENGGDEKIPEDLAYRMGGKDICSGTS